jgi:hypothetical protein
LQYSSCPSPCTSRGTCVSNGTCACSSGFTGPACETCAKGFFGPSCQSAQNLS